MTSLVKELANALRQMHADSPLAMAEAALARYDAVQKPGDGESGACWLRLLLIGPFNSEAGLWSIPISESQRAKIVQAADRLEYLEDYVAYLESVAPLSREEFLEIYRRAQVGVADLNKILAEKNAKLEADNAVMLAALGALMSRGERSEEAEKIAATLGDKAREFLSQKEPQ